MTPYARHRAAAYLVYLTLAPTATVLGQSQQDGATLERCEKKLGTVRVMEPKEETLSWLLRYKLPSPTTLLRMVIQQSNCFAVVERGAGMAGMMEERELGNSGELTSTGNVGKGQMAAADFVLTPTVLFSEGNAGGIGGFAARSLFGGALAGGLKFKEAETTILVADVRSGLQVASAQGKARKSDFGFGLLAGFTGIGAYSNTNEGKVVAASLMDNYNNIVRSVRDDPALLARAAKTSVADASGVSVAGTPFVEGDVLLPKIDVKLTAEPSATAKIVGTVKKTEELVFLGEEKAGFLRVQGSSAEGWVRKSLVAKR